MLARVQNVCAHMREPLPLHHPPMSTRCCCFNTGHGFSLGLWIQYSLVYSPIMTLCLSSAWLTHLPKQWPRARSYFVLTIIWL